VRFYRTHCKTLGEHGTEENSGGGRGIIVGNLNRMGKDHQLGVPHSHWQTKYEGPFPARPIKPRPPT
jgi:hypothetical protein